MNEPTSTVAGAVANGATTLVASVPTLIIGGVSLGLRIDVLFAGLCGALIGVVLLNTVPGASDTWQNMVRMGLKRVLVVVASALTAGYITPLAMLIANVPEPLLLGSACVVGGGAQQIFRFLVDKFAPTNRKGSEP